MEEPCQTRRGLERSIQSRLKFKPLLSVQTKDPAIRQSLFCTSQSAFQNKLAYGAVRIKGSDLEGTLG